MLCAIFTFPFHSKQIYKYIKSLISTLCTYVHILCSNTQKSLYFEKNGKTYTKIFYEKKIKTFHRLPVPWLLYGILFHEPVKVNSCGMVCSIAILFMMLLFVVLSIACFRWRMNKGLGFTMFFLYFAFVAVSLMFEYKHIVCPF